MTFIPPGDSYYALLVHIFEKADNNQAFLPENGALDPSDQVYVPNFNVIVGGRLTPISNLLA